MYLYHVLMCCVWPKYASTTLGAFGITHNKTCDYTLHVQQPTTLQYMLKNDSQIPSTYAKCKLRCELSPVSNSHSLVCISEFGHLFVGSDTTMWTWEASNHRSNHTRDIQDCLRPLTQNT